MKININNKKAIERLIKQGIGYSLYTVSNENGFEKIAIKKVLFKNKYTLTYFNTETNATEAKEVKVNISDDNTLVIEGYGTVKIQDASFTLKNPTKEVEKENEIFRQIDKRARDEEIAKSNEIQSQIIENKDAQIEQIKKEAKTQEDYYTSGRIERLESIKNKVIKTKVHHHSYDYQQVFSLPAGYHMKSSSSNYDTEESRNLNFLLKQLEEISEMTECNAFEDNTIATLISSVNEKFDSLKEYDEHTIAALISPVNENFANFKYDENKLNAIQSLYGLIAEELTKRTYALCDHIRTKEIDKNKFEYDTIIYSVSRPFYEEQHEYTQREVISNYFDTIMESVAAFVEKVTGENIREEIESRLTKKYLVVPVLMKTMNK